MKTHSLQRISSVDVAATVLRSLLPGQESPWLLVSTKDDPIAYFNILSGEGEMDGMMLPAISADISGRHYNEDAAVIAILEQLQRSVGGEITVEQ